MKLLMVTLLIALIGIGAGCETTKGAGEDIQNTGANVEESVD